MKYTIDERGIHFEIETEPIPLIDAVRICQQISQKIEALEHEPKATDAETRVGPAARDGERATEAA